MSVMVVVSNADEAPALVRWGARFAWARRTSLVVLCPSRATKSQNAEHVDLHDGDDQHPVRQAVRQVVLEVAARHSDPRKEIGPPPAEVPDPPEKDPEAEAEEKEEEQEEDASPSLDWITVLKVASPNPVEAVLGEIGPQRVSLLVVGKQVRGADEGSDLGLRLLQQAPCDCMLLRASGDSGKECERVLAPAAGGPHAAVSLKLAEAMAKDAGGVATPFFVEPNAGEEGEARAVGEHLLLKAMRQAGVHHSQWVVPKVGLADNPKAGIAAEVKAGDYDLVLVGASNEGFMKRVLFGTIPNKLISGPDPVAVAVVRRARPLGDRAAEALKALIERWIPPLERESRIVLFERLQEGSRFGIDFFALISLSTAIAALGLIQNSGAVVIGAMLVAPLMTPMIGAGLGLVQGNAVLVRDGAKAILLGFLTAVLIGYLVGLAFGGVMPPGKLTDELLARGAPNALDLIVAFLSGVAAAYALARPNLSGALPGVAIAAALVPPIGTVGISIANGAYANGQGAALLFGTNLVAIVLGAAICFRAIGVQARKGMQARLWAKRLQMALVLTVVVLAVPLGSKLVGAVAKAEVQHFVVTPRLYKRIQAEVEQIKGMSLVAVELLPGEKPQLEVVVASREEPGMTLAATLSAVASEGQPEPVKVTVVGLRYEWSHSSQ